MTNKYATYHSTLRLLKKLRYRRGSLHRQYFLDPLGNRTARYNWSAINRQGVKVYLGSSIQEVHRKLVNEL